jgi:predicted Na+-dependent transporter
VTSFLGSLLGSRFWIPAYLSFFLGFVIPGNWDQGRFLVPLFLGGILYCTCLKLPLAEVIAAIADRSRWRQVGAITAIKLAGLPLAAWAVTRLIAPQWALGVLLVCAMPAGLSSIAFTDILRGNHVLALLFVLASSVFVALTVPCLLLGFSPGTSIDPAAIGERALYILALLLIPFALAQLTRAAAPAFVQRHYQRWSGGAVICSCLLGLVSVLVNRNLWAAWDATHLLGPFALVCLLSAGILAVGVGSRRWLPPGDATAFACGIAYMNNGLSIAFAVRFFHDDPRMVLPSVLMQIPMIGSIALLGWMERRARLSA